MAKFGERTHYMMKCGHPDDADPDVYLGQVPACTLCDCHEIDHEIEHAFEGLRGRKARCVFYDDDTCHNESPSFWGLHEFVYQPMEPYDLYYCGCRGTAFD